ncbi:MAG TPA: anthranilate phosphoribosyltransferase [Phycisphaerae bacterium]|nr:anthranilate phosphoribosyltransferase [Phycisphaerae bacterium]HSA30028.1 anthranilate phosphoribosyltransferase [Phycisphaerae bacterium]
MPDIASIIGQVKAGRHLSREQTREIFGLIMTGGVEPGTMGEFLTALAAKGETVEEITGAADVMNEKVTRVRCEADCIDTCGTGGDGISTFNVSTTAAIIAASAGATVAKHGNRTHTRVSGSAEVIEELGVNLNAPVPVLERCLRECRIAFLHAPNLHPAMKYAGPVRKALRIRTIFNLLGPLTNPAGARRQLLGTPRPDLTETLAAVLAARGAAFAWVVHAHNGLCDLTVTGPTQVTEVRDGRFHTFQVHPEDVGVPVASLSKLLVNSPFASANAMRDIFGGRDQGPRRHHALLNSAAALLVAGLATDLASGLKLAAQAVDDGRASRTLDQLVQLSNAGAD